MAKKNVGGVEIDLTPEEEAQRQADAAQAIVDRDAIAAQREARRVPVVVATSVPELVAEVEHIRQVLVAKGIIEE